MLTEAELRRLLALLDDVTVVAPTPIFPFRISKTEPGYREGADGRLQAKLSIMLEAITRARP